MVEILYKNPRRGISNRTSVNQRPEHERLNIEPLADPGERGTSFRGSRPTRPDIPKQIFVSSGQNEDQSWNNQTNEAVKEPLTKDNIPEVLDEEAFSLTDLKVEEYLLMYDENIVVKGTIEIIEAALEEMLSSDSIDDDWINKIVVLKRVGVKSGVFVG